MTGFTTGITAIIGSTGSPTDIGPYGRRQLQPLHCFLPGFNGSLSTFLEGGRSNERKNAEPYRGGRGFGAGKGMDLGGAVSFQIAQESLKINPHQ
jgi:hypothetical protein